jgi:hypothetical protein
MIKKKGIATCTLTVAVAPRQDATAVTVPLHPQPLVQPYPPAPRPAPRILAPLAKVPSNGRSPSPPPEPPAYSSPVKAVSIRKVNIYISRQTRL